MVLADAFKENLFVEFIPELLTTSYLGPDPQVLALLPSSVETEGVEEGGSSSSSKIVGILFGVTWSLLLLWIVGCVSFPSVPKKAMEKVKLLYYKRKRGHNNQQLPAIEEDKEVDNGGYYDHQTPLALCNGSLREERYFRNDGDSRYLLH